MTRNRTELTGMRLSRSQIKGQHSIQFENVSGTVRNKKLGICFVRKLEKTSPQILSKFAFAVDFLSSSASANSVTNVLCVSSLLSLAFSGEINRSCFND